MKPTKILNRSRINAALSAVFNFPLTILESPMGFGKTTAVKKFVETENINPVWIAFRKFGDSSTAFWNGFTGEICKVNANAGEAMKSLGFPCDAPQLDKVLLLMNEVKFPYKTIFVMDDYQFAQNTQLSKLILLLAEEETEGLHILLITRDTTDISFVELLSKGLCHIISRQQLRFIDSEIKDYCRLMSNKISEYELTKISEYTEGWISFIYIILMGLENGIPIGMSTTVEELIEKVLFNSYDRPVQEFLLKLSIMDDFTARQAEYVTQNSNAGAILKQLNKENAFIFYDEKDKKYKIHNVLLDFLRLRQNFSSDVLMDLYSHLGEWHFESKELMAAYTFLYKAGRIEQILAYLNNPENICDELIEFEGAAELFESVPKKLLFKYPFSYLQYIFFSLVTDETDRVPECKERLNELEQFYNNMDEIEETYRNRILGEILIIRKFTLFNHLEEIKASNSEIIRLFGGQNSYIALQDNSFTFGSPHYLYLYFRDTGSFKKIADMLSADVGYAKFSNGCGTGCDYLALAEYSLETCNFAHIEINCEQARIKAENKTQKSIVICSQFTLIRYLLLKGEISAALQMIKKLELTAEKLNDSLVNTTIDLCKGYVFACLCQPEKIPVWLQIGDMSTPYFLYEGVAFNYLVYGKAVMASKRYAELEVLTERFAEQFSIFSNQLGFIHNEIFKAASKYKLYGMHVGAPILEAALNEAMLDSIAMPFVEAAPYILEMLQYISNKNPANGFIKRILVDGSRYVGNIRNLNHNSIPLSNREIQIISLIDGGLSRKQVSEQLCISQETVKTHLKSIYQKLDVNGKISAIKIAKARGYLINEGG